MRNEAPSAQPVSADMENQGIPWRRSSLLSKRERRSHRCLCACLAASCNHARAFRRRRYEDRKFQTGAAETPMKLCPSPTGRTCRKAIGGDKRASMSPFWGLARAAVVDLGCCSDQRESAPQRINSGTVAETRSSNPQSG